MMLPRRLQPLAALAVCLALAAGPGAAQERLLGYRDALASLAINTTDKLKHLIDTSNGARFAVAVLPARDGDLDVVCNPLSDALRQDFEEALLRRKNALRLDGLDIVSRQELAEGAVAVRIEWSREGDDLQLDSQVGRLLEANAARETGGTVRIRAEDAPQKGQICLPYEGIYASCTAAERIALDDSPDPAMARTVNRINPGQPFRVAAAFDDGASLLVRHSDEGAANAEVRGFVAGGVNLLRGWRDRGICTDLRLGRFTDEGPEQEPWIEGTTITDDCPGCPRMVVLPDGTFSGGTLAGSGGLATDEVRRLAMSETEITMASWLACVDEGVCSWPEAGRQRDRSMPVSVSYADARAYVEWLSAETGKRYRLPTAEEWEFAARGGAGTRYPWGDVMRPDMAVCAGCAARGVAAGAPDLVARRRENGFGLYDMHGNLWEWVSDCAGPAAPDGSCADGRRGLKGGSFRDPALALDPAVTHAAPEATAHAAIGFRVVRLGPPRR